MKRGIAVFAAALVLTGINQAQAQTREQAPGPGVVEVTIIPAGGTFFTEGKDAQGPSFGTYDIGGGVTVNFNRYVGVEGEISSALGVSQSLDFNGVSSDVKAPHQLNYSGNLMISAPTRSSVVPYVIGGVGGLSLFERASLGINDNETFLTGNVGGGVKWYSRAVGPAWRLPVHRRAVQG